MFLKIFPPQLQELAERSGLTADLVRHWFSTRAALPGPKQAAAAAAAQTTEPVGTGVAAEPPTTGSSPLEPRPGGGTEEKMEQSVCGVTPEAGEANTDETLDAAEGNLLVRNDGICGHAKELQIKIFFLFFYLKI